MTDDSQLLRRFADEHSEAAFAELVRRHLGLVYSAALRRTGGNPQLAEDASQAVFTALARNAGRLARHPALVGWLYTSTHFAAAKLVRGEGRRRAREQEAQAMQDLTSPPRPEADWGRLHPVLDDAMQQLNERDRTAILLRYFENRPFAEVGARQGLSENAARMRVERALDKLHALLAKRGITSTTAALAMLLAENALGAAPAGLAATVSSGAVAAAGAGSGGLLFWSLMSTPKALSIAAGVAALAVAAGLGLQQQATAALRVEADNLRQQAQAASALRAENERLARLQLDPAELERLRADGAEFDRLQAEWTALNAKLNRDAPAEPADAPGSPAYDVTQLDVIPKAIHQVAPVYPLAMRLDEAGGFALVSIIADREGNVVEATVTRATDPAFGEAALTAVRAWKFSPGQKSGRAVSTKMQLPISFTFVHQPPKP